ncbi:hypothetical protein [Thermosporothrix hazakensis]|uniref:hypothetical protein n=1 Tax=Thermosporothrix hazakensis TaxID=644383 RepID=UPI0010F8031C|nr:hypothetical protein [Thermosporothrix hazakensis]
MQNNVVGSTQPQQSAPRQQIMLNADDPAQPIIRTLYGGGLHGTLSFSPQISIYSDGTYVLGVEKKGQLASDSLQTLLDTLANTYNLFDFSRKQFSDIQDQNSTYLQLAFNGKQTQLQYGTFGHYQANAQDRDEYTRLGKALTAISEALTGPTEPYQTNHYALLIRRAYGADPTASHPAWPLTEYTAEQAAYSECGKNPANENTPNLETSCLKFTLPAHGLLLTSEQVQQFKEVMKGAQQDFEENGNYYTVTLRPLLPDEQANHRLAMFGSAQSDFRAVPLLQQPKPEQESGS